MKALIDFLRSHATKTLGFLQITVAAIAAVDGIIPQGQLKYWMLALGLLTSWRGFANSAAINAQQPPSQ